MTIGNKRTADVKRTGSLQRRCNKCRKGRRLQRSKIGSLPDFAPPVVNEAIASPGRPMDASTLQFMQSRLGHDFSRVRIHTGGKAAESAHAVNAQAYTVGRDVVFADGRYSPATSDGRGLLAHELVHTIQQSENRAVRPLMDEDPALERQADRLSLGLTHAGSSIAEITAGRIHSIQRKIAVNDPTAQPAKAPSGETNEKIVKDYVTKLCPDFTVKGGDVVPNAASFCADVSKSSAPVSCQCLCDMHSLTDPATGTAIIWTIDVNDNDWPHTDPTTKTVTVHSPFSGLEFGAWASGPPPHRMIEQNWLVLGHELCGHAALFATGAHPTGPPPKHGGRPSHDVTVKIENKIAAEHAISSTDLRGLFGDPHHGESFAKVTVSQFPLNSSDVTALPASEKRNLDIAEAFIKSAAVMMDVVGHSDDTGGSAATNMSISRKRAQAVKKNLVDRIISKDRFLSTTGVGSSECKSSGDQPDCRKAEIFMFIMEGASIVHR